MTVFTDRQAAVDEMHFLNADSGEAHVVVSVLRVMPYTEARAAGLPIVEMRWRNWREVTQRAVEMMRGQESLAMEIDASQQSVSAWCLGRTTPGAEFQRRLLALVEGKA